MPVIEHLEDQYLATRQATDLWQSAQLNGETVNLTEPPPSTEPKTIVATGGKGTREEPFTTMSVSGSPSPDTNTPAKPARKEFTVESPEVQAIRQSFAEQVRKVSTGEAALGTIGQAGRNLAEAIAPGIEVAGRAIGLDEEGAAALSKGMVEFMAGLPGQSESDLTAGMETALAALPMVGGVIKTGKTIGKTLANFGLSLHEGHFLTEKGAEKIQNYVKELDLANTVTTDRGLKVMRTNDAKRDIQDILDDHQMPLQGVWKEAVDALDILKSERGSVSLGTKVKEKLPGGGLETPVTWEEAIKIDDLRNEANKQFKDFNQKVSTQRQGVRTDVQVTAESIGPDALTMEQFLNLSPGTILKDSHVVGAKRIFNALGEEVRQKTQWMAANPQDQKALLGLLETFPMIEQATIKIAGVFAEPPRSTRMLNKFLPTTGKVDPASAERVRISDPYIQQWLEFFKEQDALAKTGAPALTQDKLIQALASMKTPEEFVAAAKVLARPSKWDMFIEYWINGLLSGPATHATNMLSNAATIAWGIPERQLASMYSKEVRPSEAGAMLYGILEAQGDAWRLAWQAFKAEESQMGLGKLEGPNRAITADALALTGVPGRAIDFLGSMIRLPGRALLASDDYFKSIAYRAELRALAKRESFKAVTEGGLTGQTARTRMREIEERILASPPDAIDEAAKEFAAYTTFTRELGETGQKVQQLASTPVGRLVLPFVRTPTNIFKFAGERTPLAFASQAVRDEIAAGGQRRALALAKISLGAMTMSYMGMLASQGFITGGGPKDKALRAEMMMTGWQPYSFKIGNTYYRYSRIEPLGSLIGMAADTSELLGQLSDKDAEQLASALVVAMSRNVANKTFLKGLAGTLNAVSSQDINIVKGFLEQELPTILPYSTAEGQVARFNDPIMREVNSILDAFKAKIPGLSDSLPARRNLWGEAIMLEGGLGPDLISPIYTTTKKLDPVANELVRLQMPIAMPSKNIEGVPLTPWEYDAYVVLAGGKPIIQDMTLKEKLSELMQSDLYKQSSDGPDGGKKVLIQSWVSRYRDLARFILSDAERSREYGYDFPDLRTKIQGERDKQAQQFQAVP